MYEVDWDPIKAVSNLRKHGVDFSEAQYVFEDPRALSIYDTRNSTDSEDRYIMLGLSRTGNLLVVVYADYDSLYRIISARKANRKERSTYANP